MAASAFDDATTVTPGPGPDTYEARLDASWTIGDKPNGGYLLAILARAGVAALHRHGTEHHHPLAASGTYLRAPVAPGPALVRTEVLRAGRTASQVRAGLYQGDQRCVESVLTLGRLETSARPRWSDEPPPPTTPEPDCPRVPALTPQGVRVATLEVTELRLDPAVLGFAEARPAGRGELRGWVRFADGRPPDALSLLYVLDALPPATFDLGSSGWVPTLELTAYVRAEPAPGPLLVRQRARLVDGGMVDEVCDAWDSRGRLVGQAMQLARVRFADEAPAAATP